MKKKNFNNIHKILAVFCAVSIFLTAIPFGGLYTRVYAEEISDENDTEKNEEPKEENPDQNNGNVEENNDNNDNGTENIEKSVAIEVGGSSTDGTKAGEELYLTLNKQPVNGNYTVKAKAPGGTEEKTVAATDGKYVLAEKAEAGTYSVHITFVPEDEDAGTQTKDVTYTVASAEADPEPEPDPEPEIIETVPIDISSNYVDGFEAGQKLYITVNSQDAAGTYTVKAKAPGAEEFSTVSQSEGKYVLADSAVEGKYTVNVTFTPEDSRAETRTAEQSYNVVSKIIETKPIEIANKPDTEAGKKLAIILKNQDADGKWTVEVKAPGAEDFSTVTASDGEYVLADAAVAGTYTVNIKFDAEDERASDQEKTVSYDVYNTVTVKAAEGKYITKYSDGTTDLVFEGDDTAANYFDAENLPEGVKLTVDASKWAYKTALPETPVSEEVAVTGVSAGDFSVDAADASYYKFELDPGLQVKGKILPVEPKEKTVDLTDGKTTLPLTDDITVEFDFEDGNIVNGWINASYLKDSFIFKEETITDGDETRKVTAEIVTEEKELNKDSSETGKYSLEEGKDITKENLYIVRDNVLYGPVSVKYSRDITGPEKGSVNLEVSAPLSWLMGKADAKPGVDYEFVKVDDSTTAIVATKNNIVVNALAADETDDGHSAKAYVYISKTILSKEELAALGTDQFTENKAVVAEGSGKSFAYVKFIDQAGNSVSGIVDKALLSDTNAPKVTCTLKENKKYNFTYSVTLTFTVVDGENGNESSESGIHTISVKGYDIIPRLSNVNEDYGDYSGANNGKKEVSITFAEPALNLYAIATVTDYAGNTYNYNTYTDFGYISIQGNDKVVFSFDPETTKAYKNSASEFDGKYFYNKDRTMKVSTPTGFGYGSNGEFKFSVDGVSRDWSNMTWNYTKGGYFPQNNPTNFVFNTEGLHTVTVESDYKMLEVVGLVGGKAEEFIIDKTAPDVTVEINRQANGNGNYYYGPNDDVPEITITVKETYFDEALAEVKVNGHQEKVTWETDENGAHKAVISRSEEGSYTFAVTCKDPAGNETKAENVTAIIDRTAPAYDITMNEADNQYGGVNYYGIDHKAVYTIKITETSFSEEQTIVTVNGNEEKVTWETDEQGRHFAVVEKAAEGRFDLKVSSTDLAGNASTSDTVSAIVDHTNPVVTLEASGDEPEYVEPKAYFNGDFTYIFHVEEDNFDASYFTSEVKFSADGEGSNGAVYSVDEAAHTFTHTVSGTDGASDGTYSFTFYGTDLAKNAVKFNIVKNNTDIFAEDECDKVTDQYETGGKVLDTVHPLVTLQGSGDAPVYIDNDGTYFNGDFTYTFTVDEPNFLPELFKAGVEFTADGEGKDGSSIKTDKEAQTFTFTVSGESGSADGAYVFTFEGKDIAGNEAKFDISADESYVFADDECTEVKAQYISGKKYLDTVVPVAEYKITSSGEYGDDGLSGYKDDEKTYYNAAFDVAFTLDELHFTAVVPGAETPAGPVIGLYAEKALNNETSDMTSEVVAVSGNVFTAHIKAELSEAAAEAANKKAEAEAAEGEEIVKVFPDEGEYQFTFSGCDKAGNPVTIKSTDEGSSEDLGSTYSTEEQEPLENGIYVTGIKVLDITAPVFAKTVDKDDIIKAENLEGTTAYYKENITVTWDITEKYFDSESIGAGLVDNTADDYQTAAESISWSMPSGGEHYSSDKTYKVSTTKDGVYAFTIAGKDKAGNRLSQASGEAAISANWKKTRKNQDGEYWTYAKVVDTVAPNGYLKIKNNGGTEYYKYAVGSGEGVDYSEPYRKGETFATVNIAVTKDHHDHSPVKINYTINSSNTSWTQKMSDTDYAYMQSKSKGTVDGAQYIQVVDIVLTDRAGNVTQTSSPNKMSLDNGIPTDDELAPTIQMTVRSNSSEFGPFGQPLYRTKNGGNYGTLHIDLLVNDPNPNSSSSGLDSVTYEIYINGSKVHTSAELISASGNYHQTEFNENYTDTDPIISFKYDIPVDGNNYNYNDIKIIAYAKDRAGHTTQREIALGIDNTEPKITVSYDNNSAQNGKYFKENRVATVTVRERNFDANAVKITTQAAAVQSGWTPHYDHSGNGDNTTWTKTITYATDGDYTLDVTAKDLLGWDAGKADYGNSVAPQEFTIDKTKPVITISFDNTNLKNTVNGTEYYDAARVATILVKEHNFGKGDVRKETIEASNPDPSISLAKPGLNGWSNNGDNHTATVSCTADGVYRITFNYTDLAGNVAEQVVTAQYVVDTTQPTVEWVAGSVKNETSYPGTIAPAVEVADTFMNWDGVTFELVGARNGKVTVTEQDMEHISDFLGRKSYNNFPVQRKYDDIYTLTAHVIDLSGNEQTIHINFSVNRFGSTWDYNNDPVTIGVVDRYYINQEKPVMIREINPTKVTEWHTYLSHAGEYKELKEGTDFTMVPNTSGKSGWNEYIYHFSDSLFEEEGLYEVYVQTTDEAKNPNSNGSVHGDDDQTYEVVPRFIVDKTNPRSTLTDATDMSKHQYLEDEVPINIVPTDNYALARVDIYINDELRDSFFNDPENENYRLRDTLEANNNTIPWILSSKDAAQILRVECFDAAGNRSGYSIQNEFIDDPKDPEILTWNVVVTKNVAIQYINNRVALGATGLGLLLLLLLLLAKRKKDEEEKKAAA